MILASYSDPLRIALKFMEIRWLSFTLPTALGTSRTSNDLEVEVRELAGKFEKSSIIGYFADKVSVTGVVLFSSFFLFFVSISLPPPSHRYPSIPSHGDYCFIISSKEKKGQTYVCFSLVRLRSIYPRILFEI